MKILKNLIILLFIMMGTDGIGQDEDFNLLSSALTGVTFNNEITENVSTSENLFDYDYFYNGSGVGIIDINNDGLQDIYFAANQKNNELYLNKGDFKFKEISSSAFLEYKTDWSTGVSVVDINNDGWQDLYVCQSGPFIEEKRRNLLFLNNGDNTFTESAKEFGLADEGMSSQAVFFDFDKDGDLDCFVLNESIAYGLDPISFTRLNLEQRKQLYVSYSHMYINDDGIYVDKSIELGLDKPTFGLGLKVSDFNGDGWKDIYVSNDYYLPDMMLINQEGKGFSNDIEDYLKQMSFYGMGLDIADINNDGLNDIFVLDMASGDHYRSKTLMRSMNVDNFNLLVNGLGFPHQYMFNSLQLARGTGAYSNISQLSGVSSTDWSWSALIEDFDFDGLKDIHVTNGYRRYALDNDFQAKIREAHVLHNKKVPLEVKKELYDQMPTEKLQNVFFKNVDGMRFKDWEIEYENNPPSYSNGAAIADFDNDGDPDMVISNLDNESFIYRNLSVEKNRNNFLTIKTHNESSEDVEKVQLEIGSETLSFDLGRVRGYLSSSEPTAFIGLGEVQNVDEIKIFWANGESTRLRDVEVNKIHELIYDANLVKSEELLPVPPTYFEEVIPASIGIDYIHVENEYNDFEKEILLPIKQSSRGPFVSTGDVNNDSLDDIIFSNSAGGSIAVYTQTTTGFEKHSIGLEENNLNQESGEISAVDLDKNGVVDFLVPASGNEMYDNDEYYRSNIVLGDSKGVFQNLKLPLTSGSTSKIITIDYNNDGYEDIIECKRHVAQKYPLHAPSHIYKSSNLKFEDVTKSVFPDLMNYGIINDILVTDFNKDGWVDVIVVGEWADIRFYKNEKGVFTNSNQEFNIPSLKGMWFSAAAIDINGDSIDDYIFGNIGTNSKYKASIDKPLKVYGHDFDNNGTWDLVLSKLYKEDYVPLRGLECSSQQMPFIQDKFETYDLFAKATIDDVYGSSLDSAYFREVNTLSSIIILSDDNSGFDVKELPVEVQISPVLDFEVLDVNFDGAKDIIFSGNIYDTEVETPRLDGGHGGILLNNQKGGFTMVDNGMSGLDLNYNIKSTTTVFHKGGNCHVLIATENNGAAKTFVLNQGKANNNN